MGLDSLTKHRIFDIEVQELIITLIAGVLAGGLVGGVAGAIVRSHIGGPVILLKIDVATAVGVAVCLSILIWRVD